MIDREKVIKGLEYCAASCKGAWDEENGCPYMSDWIEITLHEHGRNGRCVDLLATDALALLKAQPAVDAVPVKHGRWITNKHGETVCSECDNNALRVLTGCTVNRHFKPHKSKFCPSCGARMDGESDG